MKSQKGKMMEEKTQVQRFFHILNGRNKNESDQKKEANILRMKTNVICFSREISNKMCRIGKLHQAL